MVILMKIIYKIFVNGGKFIVISLFLLVISISLTSFTTKGEVIYGGRCNMTLNDQIITTYTHPNLKLTSNYLGCNTYYLEYDSSLKEKDNILFLASLSKLLSDNDIEIDTHVIIKCEEYQLMATIVDYNISYTKSII